MKEIGDAIHSGPRPDAARPAARSVPASRRAPFAGRPGCTGRRSARQQTGWGGNRTGPPNGWRSLYPRRRNPRARAVADARAAPSETCWALPAGRWTQQPRAFMQPRLAMTLAMCASHRAASGASCREPTGARLHARARHRVWRGRSPTTRGRQAANGLLARELTHVVQQRGSRVPGRPRLGATGDSMSGRPTLLPTLCFMAATCPFPPRPMRGFTLHPYKGSQPGTPEILAQAPPPRRRRQPPPPPRL